MHPPVLERFLRWATRVRLWNRLAVSLAIASLVSGVATYGGLSGWGPFGRSDPETIRALLYIDLVLVIMLSAVVVRHLVELWLEHRRGVAGAQLHIRFVALFSVVAVAPALCVTVFSVLFFDFGIESWFSERVRTALDESVAVAEAYLDEHRQVIRADALAMANDINRTGPTLLTRPRAFGNFLATQAALRSLTHAMVFRRNGRVIGRTGLTFSLIFEPLPMNAIESADMGQVVILTNDADDQVRALVRLDAFVDAYLFVGRFVDARAISHMQRTKDAVSEYQRLEGERSGIQFTFAAIFTMVTILLLLAAVWLGLTYGTQLARPLSNLIAAAERVRSGDLTSRVPEADGEDEIAGLSRAFNRMTEQLESQRQELLDATRQIDARRRFIESVLTGVSAGVIGLDSQGRIELPNRSALDLLALQSDELIGRELADVVPEMAALLKQARRRPARRTGGQISIVRDGRTRTLQLSIAAERLRGEVEGFVVTFDDITALVAAQRSAAWGDVAQRIAHEIKNPLTPIQLSAERIKRKYLGEISSDPEVFERCTETIVRHVADIGRMIDEFSDFARMPSPSFDTEDVADLVRQALTAQEIAHPDIAYAGPPPGEPVPLRCDGRQVVQVLTNILQNAAEAITRRKAPAGESLEPGRIGISLASNDDHVEIEVRDNGPGLPEGPHERLVEPYVTTRAKGTGLGLAIVRRIVEDHGGRVVLEDDPGGGARVRLTFAKRVKDPEAPDDDWPDGRKVGTHGA
jgi:two-component system nitrogen regulation sensor histidine kinase NtrY